MKITMENYETVFIDYIDGNLNEKEVSDLFRFLEMHPGLKEELELVGTFKLEVGQEIFSKKEILKRGEINTDTFTHYLIAEAEGDLTDDELMQLHLFIQSHPEISSDRILFSKVKLIPDTQIVFPGKAELKKTVPLFANPARALYYAVAAAIAVLLISGTWFVITKNSFNVDPRLAQNHSVITNEHTLQSNTEEEHSGEIDIQNKAATSEKLRADYPVKVAASGGINKIKMAGENKRVTQKETQVIPSTPIQVVFIHNELPELAVQTKTMNAAPVISGSPNPVPDEEYESVFAAVKKLSTKKMNKVSGINDQDEAYLASLEGDQKPKWRIMDLIEKGVSKISNDKVQLNTNYDEGGMVAYSLSAGDFHFEKK